MLAAAQHRDRPAELDRTRLYYYVPMAASPEELAVKDRIDELYTRWPFYGDRRITAQLHQEGVLVNHKGWPVTCGRWGSPVLLRDRT